jgi:2,4-dichlorophenol 6-monooxygenase
MGDSRRTSVLIAGGGPSGLVAFILLRQLGVDVLLVERRDSNPALPKAHILNQRTVEILTRCGMHDEVLAQGSPHHNMSRVAWYTSLAGDGPLHRREIGWCDSWGGGRHFEMHRTASPYLTTNLPQMRLEPLLLARARTLAAHRLLHGHEVRFLSQDQDAVRAEITELSTGRTVTVTCDYVIGCDGGRTVGPLVGIELAGTRDAGPKVSAHVTVDLSDLNPDPAVCMYRFVNPDERLDANVLVKIGGQDWGTRADEWVFTVSLRAGERPDEAYIVDRLRRAIGDPDREIAVHRVSPWTVESLVATRYREGRVLLVGDAAHRHPPTGGLGLNSAVADADNLTWKLHYVLRGQAGAALLDTYETERRPVAMANAAQSLQNLYEGFGIYDALNLSPDLSPDQGWNELGELYADSPAGEARRAALGEALTRKRHEFGAQNLEMGYTYSSAAVVPDGTQLPVGEDQISDFVASTYPGHRIPHAWLTAAGLRLSTYELTGRGRFALIATTRTPWEDAVDQARRQLGIDIDLILVGPGLDWADEDDSWARQVGPAAEAVLVRPDQHVAWRSASPTATAQGFVEIIRAVLAADQLPSTARTALTNAAERVPG